MIEASKQASLEQVGYTKSGYIAGLLKNLGNLQTSEHIPENATESQGFEGGPCADFVSWEIRHIFPGCSISVSRCQRQNLPPGLR